MKKGLILAFYILVSVSIALAQQSTLDNPDADGSMCNCPDKCEGGVFYVGECFYDNMMSLVCHHTAVRCDFGCNELGCLPPPQGPTVCECPDKCEGDFFLKGDCIENICSYTETRCEFGCTETGCSQEPPIGICECPDRCDGDHFLKGECVNSQCTYSKQLCEFGCAETGCLPKLEEPTVPEEPAVIDCNCQNLCEKNRYYESYCVDGICNYKGIYCEHGCDEAGCLDKPPETVAETPLHEETPPTTAAEEGAAGREAETEDISITDIIEEIIEEETKEIDTRNENSTEQQQVSNINLDERFVESKEEDVKEIITREISPKEAIEEESLIKGYKRAINRLDIEKKITKVESVYRGEKINRSVVTIQIKPIKRLYNVKIYEKIPKETASHISEVVIYTPGYRVVEPDPLIVWAFKELDKEVKIMYSVKKPIIEETVTIPIVEENPNFWKVMFGLALIPIVVFVFLYFNRFQKKEVYMPDY